MSLKFELLYRNDDFIAKLAETLAVDTLQAKYLTEMFCTGRVKNVSKIYKTTVGLLSKLKVKTSFTFIEGAKGSFLYIGSFEFMNKAQVAAAGAKVEDEELKTFFKGFKKIAAKFSFTTGQFKLKEYKKDTEEAVMSILKIKGTQGKEGLAAILNATDDFADKTKTKFRVFVPEVDTEEGNNEGDGEESVVDSATLIKKYQSIVAAFNTFKTGPKAEYDKNSSSKEIIKNVSTSAKDIANKVAKFLAQASENSELSEQVAKINKVATNIKAFRTKLKADVESLGSTASNSTLDTLSKDITSKIADLRNKYGDQIDSIPGLKAALDSVA